MKTSKQLMAICIKLKHFVALFKSRLFPRILGKTNYKERGVMSVISREKITLNGMLMSVRF